MQDKQVLVKWSLVGESNIVNYNIERSAEGTNFSNIATVMPTAESNYSYVDKTANEGLNYYRIKLTDNAGVVTYSKVVTTQFTVNNYQLSIFPNPTKHSVTIYGNHIAAVQVINNAGSVIKVLSLKDATNPTFSVNSLQAGVYHLRIQTTNGKVCEVGFIKE